MAFAEAMKAMTEDLAKSRAERARAMTELHSASSRDRKERVEDLNRLFGHVHVQIQHFHSDRGKMRKELRHMLGEFFGQTQKYVRGFLKDFRTQHKAMSGKQQAELKAFRAALEKDVKTLMGQLRERIEELAGQSQAVRKEARAMIREYRADSKKAHGYWMGFAGKMEQARRSARPGVSNVQDRVRTALGDSPGGMTVKELSYAMGMPGKGLTRTLARMRRAGQVTRRRKTFFAR